MVDKSRIDGRVLAVSPASPASRAAKQPDDARNAVISTFGLERRAGRNVARRPMRPINLERRARFARIESV
ncbi:hypothetical protein [Methylocystis sp. S23]|jgi:hypothetical protein